MIEALLIVSPLLKFLTADHDIDGWDDVAVQWLLAIVFIAVFTSVGVTALKWWIKAYFGRGIIKKITWSHRGAWAFVTLGFVITALFCSAFWAFGRDLRTIVGYRGLMVGMALSGVVHLGIAAAFYRLFNWLRELF